MLKTPRKLKKMLILPCMCSITFYLGSQIMTYTEAAFIHETKVEAALSTAIIFPKTVDTLKEEAEKHKQSIEHEYGEMKEADCNFYRRNRTGNCSMATRT